MQKYEKGVKEPVTIMPNDLLFFLIPNQMFNTEARQARLATLRNAQRLLDNLNTSDRVRAQQTAIVANLCHH